MNISLKSVAAPLVALMVSVAMFFIGSTASAQETAKVIVQFDGPVQASDKAFLHGLGGVVNHEYLLVPAMAVEIPEKALAGLLRNPRVALVEADVAVQAMVFDDEYRDTWSIANVNATAVHGNGNTGASVKVGIIDSGVDYNHPDLSGNYKGGQNFVNSRGKPVDEMDVYGHGTHVAGTVCASMNTWGAVGVSPSCDLYGLRVLNNNGSGRTSDILAAIEWAVDQGLDVVNLSLGSSGNPGATAQAVYQAAYDAGLVIVAAAGNSGTSNTGEVNTIWPANYDSVIAVAATDSNDIRAYFSSTGSNVEISAPGVSVHSTWNDSTSPHNPQPVCDIYDCYKDGSGTSMASPQVAGVAALIIAAGVTDTNGNGNVNDEVRAILQSTATDLGSSNRDSVYGFGLVNAQAAAAAVAPAGPQAPIANAGTDQTVSDGDNDGVVYVVLDGSGSSDADGVITSYGWDIDSDGIVDTTGVTTTVGFGVIGSPYIVTLTVTDNDGATSSDSASVTVNTNQAPTANAGTDQTVNDNDGDEIESVTLTAGGSSDTDGAIVSYVWSEGGVEIATGVSPDVVLSLGLHTILLEVTDNGGETSTDTVVVEVVTPVPPAPISLNLTGTKEKGRHVVTLTWDGAITAAVDIHRDGVVIQSNTANDGVYADNTGNHGGRTYMYQVCEAGSITSCSDEQQITF